MGTSLDVHMIPGTTILIVQRSWVVANQLARAFQSRGARTLSAPDAASALPLVVDERDLSAAVLDGESQPLCTPLSQRHIPYVIYSGRSQVKGCEEGTIVRKPGDLMQVVAELDHAIEQHRRS